jgi:hypothetical protein
MSWWLTVVPRDWAQLWPGWWTKASTRVWSTTWDFSSQLMPLFFQVTGHLSVFSETVLHNPSHVLHLPNLGAVMLVRGARIRRDP